MLEVSGGFVLKCDNCGMEKEYGAETMSLTKVAVLEVRPLGLLMEYSFHAEFRCRCGQDHRVLLRALEYPESFQIEGSERTETEGCTCLEPPDVDSEASFPCRSLRAAPKRI